MAQVAVIATGGRAEGSVRAAIRVIAVMVFAGILIWLIAVRHLSQMVLDSDGPVASLRVDPQSAEAQAQMAAYALAEDRRADVRRMALAALRSAALSPLALRSLMIASALDGETAKSRALLRTALRLGWRDEPTQLAGFAAALQAGQMTQAADRLDAIARSSPQPWTVFPLIDGWLSNDAFDRAITLRLAANPPWRRRFLTAVSQLDDSAASARLRIALALTRGDREQARGEVQPYVRRLLARGDYGNAHKLWHDAVADRTLADDGGLFDGDFRNAVPADEAVPFEWSLFTSDVASAAPDSVDGRPVLHVQTDGTSDAKLAEQMVALPPGTHSFEVAVENDAGKPMTSFQWRITCGPDRAPVAEKILQVTQDPRSSNRHELRLDFNVPATGCPYQTIALYVSSTDIPDNMTYLFSQAAIH